MIVPGSAIFSECRKYRYVLTRHIPQLVRWVRPCLLIMLNPSDANAEENDPTITRCDGFATSWLCTSLTVVNLYGLVATDPKELAIHPSPIGPDNDKHLHEQLEAHWKTGVIVAAWGANAAAKHHSRASILQTLSGRVHCLGVNKDGSPKHPLYLPKAQLPVPWKMPE